jgi:hypothetical protein
MDDLSKRGKPDRNLVAFDQHHERVLVCHRMRIDELHLALAILGVGHSRRAVKARIEAARRWVDSVRKPKVKNAPKVRSRRRK